MLKSSSLCLYSSNLGTFWLKIEQFWPFEEISIFSNGGHLGYRTALARKCPNLNCISIMMSFLTYITGFFMNFELLPILTDYEIKKRGDEIKKIFPSETTEPISTKLVMVAILDTGRR
jgi:hypothetical protein